jgi:hypothetical protein
VRCSSPLPPRSRRMLVCSDKRRGHNGGFAGVKAARALRNLLQSQFRGLTEDLSMAAKPIPDGYHSVTPYLCVRGAARAIEFYKKAFLATERMRIAHPDGRVGHAELQVGDSVIMLSDEFPEMDVRSPQNLGGSWLGRSYWSAHVIAPYRSSQDGRISYREPSPSWRTTASDAIARGLKSRSQADTVVVEERKLVTPVTSFQRGNQAPTSSRGRIGPKMCDFTTLSATLMEG